MKSIVEKAVNDPHPRVRLWAVSVLSQLSFSDTVKTALRALDGLEHPDDFLDFAVWSICREHSHKWTTDAAEGNPFANPGQLLYAMRANGIDVGSDIVFSAFRSGEIKTDTEIADLSDWAARSGGPKHLDQLYESVLSSRLSENQQATILQALVNAAKLRKIRPGSNLNRITDYLDTGNSALFKPAAALAGLWKIPTARRKLEQAFVSQDGPRATAALEGLRNFGGHDTAVFLTNLAKDTGVPEPQRARALNGLARFQPAPAARLAARVLNSFKNPANAESIFSTSCPTTAPPSISPMPCPPKT